MRILRKIIPAGKGKAWAAVAAIGAIALLGVIPATAASAGTVYRICDNGGNQDPAFLVRASEIRLQEAPASSFCKMAAGAFLLRCSPACVFSNDPAAAAVPASDERQHFGFGPGLGQVEVTGDLAD
jgi:hypothetical protein